MPVAVPTMPCARLKWPLPKATSATIKRNHDREHRGGNAVEYLHRDQQIGIRHDGEQQAANRQRAKTREQERPPPPSLRHAPDPSATVSATIACGTMMQKAISTGAHSLERVVTTPAISGSIAALASCSSSTLPAKIR